MTMRDRIIHEWTAMDEKMRQRDKHWNRYALGHILQAMDGYSEDAVRIGDARAYAERFTPSREGHAVARKLGLGLDVERGRWILPDGSLL